MKIAVIGVGSVGLALGTRLSKSGHRVRFGVREPDSPRYGNLGEDVVTIGAAIEEAEVVMLATPWKAAQNIAKSLPDWGGRILVDCTNPIADDFSGLEIGHTDSGAEQIARWANGARVVKSFNQTGFENMANPEFPLGRGVMFVAGDDADAVQKVQELARQIGFNEVDAGPLHISRQLEQLAWLWIHLAVKKGAGRDFGFILARRS